MNRRGWAALTRAVVLVAPWLGVASAHSSAASTSTNTGDSAAALAGTRPYIVSCRRGVDLEELLKQHTLTPRFTYRHAINGFAAHISPEITERLKGDSRVLAVEPDGAVGACGQAVPSGVGRIGIPEFPEARIDQVDARIDLDVAVLDTGVQTNHPDLNVVQSVDFTGEGHNGDDWNGHGTWVAGIIGALDNDYGVVGVAPGVRIWSVQVLGTNTIPGWSQVVAGIDYIATNADKIAVVNASLGNTSGGTVPYTAVHEAVLSLVNQDVVFVAGAGNLGQDLAGPDGVFGINANTGTCDDMLPSGLAEVMAVSALYDHTDTIWVLSNRSTQPHVPSYVFSSGAAIDVAAPGVSIYSTTSGSGYSYHTGTSGAAPHAAGVVALYIAANGRGHTAEDVYRIRQAIVDNSLPQSRWRSYPDTNDQDGNPEPMVTPSLAWLPPVVITNPAFTPQGFQLSFNAVPGYNHRVQYSTTPGGSSEWTTLTTLIGTGKTTFLDVADTSQVSGSRFYRVQRQPATQPTTTNCIPLPAGAIAWWRAEYNASDAVGNNNGSLLGDFSFEPGEVGRAFSFEGSQDFIAIPYSPTYDFSPSNEFTLEAWVKPELNSQWQPIAVKSPASGAWDWGLFLSPGGQFVMGTENVSAVTSVTTAQNGQWYHVAMTYTNGTRALFVNGALEAQGDGLFVTQSTGGLAIGRKGEASSSPGYLSGLIDEVCIYSRALSPVEIAAIYNAGTAGKCLPSSQR